MTVTDIPESRPPRRTGRRRVLCALCALIVCALCAVAVVVPLTRPAADHRPHSFTTPLEHARYLMQHTPLIDGHNDLPLQYYSLYHDQVDRVDLRVSTAALGWHTDIPRLREGLVGAQFWSAYVPCGLQFKDAVRATLEQVDVVHRITDRYPDVFEFAWTAHDVERIFAAGKIASMIGVEGGHSIDSSLATLRVMYGAGVRYLTLTHNCCTPWADSWTRDGPTSSPITNGLTEFGKSLVLEMNRLGMLVDLAHVSKQTMLDALNATRAPLIFSHSSAYGVCASYRNVQDDVLLKLAANQGIIMINFYNNYVACGPNATIADVVAHFNYIKDLIGSEYIGIGGDYDGVDRTPVGLEDVSRYPYLIAALLEDGWSEADVNNILGRNLLRVLKHVEKVKLELSQIMDPVDDYLTNLAIDDFSNLPEINGTANICRKF